MVRAEIERNTTVLPVPAQKQEAADRLSLLHQDAVHRLQNRGFMNHAEDQAVGIRKIQRKQLPHHLLAFQIQQQRTIVCGKQPPRQASP